jgi:hypothetical protein
METEEPSDAQSRTDSENRDPSRTNPKTDTADASRAKVLSDRDDPTWSYP